MHVLFHEFHEKSLMFRISVFDVNTGTLSD